MFAKYRYLQLVLTLLLVAIFSSVAVGWQQVSKLPTLRTAKATAVVGDNIYLIGGINEDENLGGGAPALSRVDVYDTQTNTWHKAADMLTPRIAPKTAVFSSDIYVFGGYTRTAILDELRKRDVYKKTVEVYDTRTDTWVKKRDMPTLRRSFGTAVVDGKIYIIGGNVHNKQLGKEVSTGLVEVYDPLTERWERGADMLTKRGWLNVAVVDGKIYVIGGFILLEQGLGLDVDRFSRRIEEYNPKTNSWRRLPDMPTFKYAFSSVVVDDEIYTMGGYDLDNRDAYLDLVEVYNPIVNRWRPSVPMLTPKMTTAAVANGTIYLLGGTGDDGNGRRYVFSPVVEAFDTGFRAVDAKGKRAIRWGEIKKPNE